MANTLKVYLISGVLIFTAMLLGSGCKKDEYCNPTPSKFIISQVENNGFAISNRYTDNVIRESRTSDGLIIDYDIIANQQGEELLFQEWNYMPNSAIRILIGTYYLGFNPLNVPRENLPRANRYVREGGGIQSFEYNNNGNLIRSSLIFPPNFNIPPQIVINTWKDGNMMSSVIGGVTTTYEYYDEVNTIGNEYFAKTYLGVSSKNALKREVSHSSVGNLITDYVYEYDQACYISKVTMTTIDETGEILSSSWREFSYQ